MTEEPVEVIQADRDRAAEFLITIGRLTVKHGDAIRDGGWDETYDVQAFARHRLSHSAEKEALIEALAECHAAVEALVTTWIESNRPAGFYPNGADDCDDDEDQDRWDRFVAARSTLLSMRNNGNG